MKGLDAATLADCLSAIHGAIAALEPYDGVPFKRKPIGFRKAGGTAGAATAGPEEAALAALERAGHDLIGLFHGLEERLAASCTTRAARRKTPKAEPSGVLTPPKVAKQLGVSPDKILDWIRKGELNATNVATGSGGRPRYRISEEDLSAFQRARQPSKPPPASPRRKKIDPGSKEFY
jgi:excisionase family DNA binding protein